MGEAMREGNWREGDNIVAQGMVNKLRCQKSSIRNIGETKADWTPFVVSFETPGGPAHC